VVDKETEWTSHDVVAKARGVFSTRKIGHSGTLDPGATGVLVLGVGRGTRLLRFITELEKTYVAEAVLGVETDSLDADGEVTVRHDMSGVTIDDVRRVASQFVGNIEQIPPMVSAVKIDGKRLHELAREGKTVERKPRPVTVHELTIDPTFVETPQDEPDVFRFTTRCGSGTYIRTIAADIGAALGGGAHIRYLRRTAIGRHTEAHASTLEKATIISLAEGLADYRSVILDDDTVARVRNGQRLSEEILTGAGPWVLLDGQGAVVAVHERVEGGKIKPAVVIPAET
jgi:tRNA pseudouridine55 synthase